MSSPKELPYSQSHRTHDDELENKTQEPVEPDNKDEEAVQQNTNSEDSVSASRDTTTLSSDG